MRDKLIELLKENEYIICAFDCEYGEAADNLIANGVTIRPKGKWGNPIKVDADNNGYKCSQCGEFGVPCYNFCPNCGADMRSHQKSLCDQNEKENDEDAELQQLYARR